ncbi:MAG: hypothetical protein PF693_04960 [Spirochaetia bacterium]|nr:hypothetical protein [Spirochaetia bacterium]
MNKLIKELMIEYSLTIDDIRWFVSYQKTTGILSERENPNGIIKYIWSGKLEADLYNMEERYLEDMASQQDRSLVDESWIREQFAEASEIKCRRY